MTALSCDYEANCEMRNAPLTGQSGTARPARALTSGSRTARLRSAIRTTPVVSRSHGRPRTGCNAGAVIRRQTSEGRPFGTAQQQRCPGGEHMGCRAEIGPRFRRANLPISPAHSAAANPDLAGCPGRGAPTRENPTPRGLSVPGTPGTCWSTTSGRGPARAGRDGAGRHPGTDRPRADRHDRRNIVMRFERAGRGADNDGGHR